jgi:hypothetical protein
MLVMPGWCSANVVRSRTVHMWQESNCGRFLTEPSSPHQSVWG